jgi:thiamine-monophosphate kinase
MDLSDGLALDLHRLCLASNVSADIEPPPLFRGASLEQALHGGEDYELLFTAPATTRVPRSIAGVPITQIGRILPWNPRRKRSSRMTIVTGNDRFTLQPQGWEHLR